MLTFLGKHIGSESVRRGGHLGVNTCVPMRRPVSGRANSITCQLHRRVEHTRRGAGIGPHWARITPLIFGPGDRKRLFAALDGMTSGRRFHGPLTVRRTPSPTHPDAPGVNWDGGAAAVLVLPRQTRQLNSLKS